jgi:NAD(P)-dependent dehydrogenase (short-subunit alcohol dehydrogenase family)
MSTDNNIRGKIVILTGAAGGIGRQIASHLAKEGATLVLGDIDAKSLEEVAEQVRAEGGEALAHPMNLRKADEIAGLVEAALDAFGRIDILINNAGLGYFEWIEEMPHERLREQFEVNVIGPAELIRQVVPVMKEQRAGHIINVASYASRLSAPPMTVYSSTKYAVEGLTDGLRRELEPWISALHASILTPSRRSSTPKPRSMAG